LKICSNLFQKNSYRKCFILKFKARNSAFWLLNCKNKKIAKIGKNVITKAPFIRSDRQNLGKVWFSQQHVSAFVLNNT